MNTVCTKLKTSATLWSVIGGFILGIANLIWGADTTASSISSAILFAAPAVTYIAGKYCLRIKMADIDADGKISLQELAIALSIAANETSEEAQQVIDAFGDVLFTFAEQTDALVDQGDFVPDKEGE